MTAERRRTRRRALHLAIAVAIAFATFGVQLLDPDNAVRIGAFYTVAVVVGAMSLGLGWALGLVGLSLVLDVITDPGVLTSGDLIDRWPRVFVLIVIALVTARLTERLRYALRRSRTSEERFRRSFDDSHVGMAIVALEGEHAGRMTEANAALADLLGTPVEKLIGHLTIAEFVPEEIKPEIREQMTQLQNGEIPVLHRELEVIRPDGRRLWTELTASMVRDETGKPIYRISQLEDIDARRRAEDKLRWLADHDSMTDLPNRRRFVRELDAEVNTRSHGAVVIGDLDGFKQVNDTLGHAAGDRVLALVAQLLRTGVRSGDIVARVGGDEFGILLRRVEAEDVSDLLAKLVAQVNTGLELERPDNAPTVTLSAGSVWFDAAQSPDAADLLAEADKAMYVVKERHHRLRAFEREAREVRPDAG